MVECDDHGLSATVLNNPKKEANCCLAEYSQFASEEVPNGAPDNVVRTVTDNSRTLRFTSHGFEKE